MQGVIARAAGQPVVRARYVRIALCAAEQTVIARLPVEDVAAFAALHPVTTRAAVQRVVSREWSGGIDDQVSQRIPAVLHAGAGGVHVDGAEIAAQQQAPGVGFRIRSRCGRRQHDAEITVAPPGRELHQPAARAATGAYHQCTLKADDLDVPAIVVAVNARAGLDLEECQHPGIEAFNEDAIAAAVCGADQIAAVLRAENVHVCAGASIERIAAPAAFEQILTRIASQHVAAVTAQQCVVAFAATERVVAGGAAEVVGAFQAEEGVTQLPTCDCVIARGAEITLHRLFGRKGCGRARGREIQIEAEVAEPLGFAPGLCNQQSIAGVAQQQALQQVAAMVEVVG